MLCPPSYGRVVPGAAIQPRGLERLHLADSGLSAPEDDHQKADIRSDFIALAGYR
jgi:hypothetical protein